MKIADWQLEARPREKMMQNGVTALSEAELLAILIGSGSADENAVSLMQHVLTDCNGSLRRLGGLSLEELCLYKGIGPAKAISILAACELGGRRARENGEVRKKMDHSKAIYSYFYDKMRDLPTEECHVMLLNQNLSLIGTRCIGKGGITEAPMDIRTILREAILARATHIAVCHNHPSGNRHPSQADNALTQKLKQAAAELDIRLIDHLVLAGDEYYSYADEGTL